MQSTTPTFRPHRTYAWLPVGALCCLLCLAPTPATAMSDFIRGDFDGDGAISIADVVSELQYLFAMGSATCVAAGDFDDDGSVALTDPIQVLQFLFQSGPAPAPPFPSCGPNSPTSLLTCDSHAFCDAQVSPPLTVDYTYATAILEYGYPMPVNVPMTTGGAPTSYSIMPALPSGIVFDVATGAIYGTPVELSGALTYTVVASNPGGAASTTIQLTVVNGVPTNFVYSEPMATYIDGQPIRPNVPTLQGGPVIGYSVTPALPTGLTMSTTSGIISGTPNGPALLASYSVTVTTPAGSAVAAVVIEVPGQPGPPPLAPNDFYTAPQMHTPRYGHTSTTLPDGRVVLVGGSDERHFTSLEGAEIYDDTIVSMPVPATGTGAFIDLDFSGNPIEMDSGGRVFHTATLLNDGNLLVVGGSVDIFVADAEPEAEIFDPQTREFNPPALAITNPMINPRFDHTATLLPNGNVLIAGGQLATNVTIIDPNFPPGNPLFMIDIQTFPSTEEVEIFDATTRTFVPALDLSGQAVELQTARGRSAHTCVTIGGFDNDLGTSDDVCLIAGGFRTLSPLFAPQTKLPPDTLFSFETTGLEYYDSASGLISVAASISLTARSQGGAANLGAFNGVSPAGVDGAANVMLVANGITHAGTMFHSDAVGEVIVATFTGFGPANGIQFHIASQMSQNVELAASTIASPPFGRAAAPLLALPSQRTYSGMNHSGTWVFTAGGSHVAPSMGAQGETLIGFAGNEIVGGMLFDPFYNAALANPSDLGATTSLDNPTGIIGTWLNTDSVVPEDSLFGFAGPTPADLLPLRALSGAKVFHAASLLPGPDLMLGTGDDRVLISGGGMEWLQTGGDPSPTSAEVYVQP